MHFYARVIVYTNTICEHIVYICIWWQWSVRMYSIALHVLFILAQQSLNFSLL